jgi:hypothetical protein
MVVRKRDAMTKPSYEERRRVKITKIPEALWFCEDCGHRRSIPVGFQPVAPCACGEKNWQLVKDDMGTNCPECADELDNRDTKKCEVCQRDGLCSQCLVEHDCEK